MPYVCLECEAAGTYYGRLVFPQELGPTPDMVEAVAANGGSLEIPAGPPACPNHKKPVPLTPAHERKEAA